MASGLYWVILAQPLADLITSVLCALFCVHTFRTLNKLCKEPVLSEEKLHA